MRSGAAEAFFGALVDDDPLDLYEHAPCAYLSLLPDGTIVRANETFLAWSGYEARELLGRCRLADLLAPGDRIYYETHLAPLLLMQGKVREIAVEVVVADGSRLPVLANAVLRRDASGAPLAVRVALFDATERRGYERELLNQQRRAEASEERALRLARTLQASLLPPHLIQPAGLELGASYRPAGDGSRVGGDFYDVFETADGSVAVLLGDVVGKDVQAAVQTMLVRHTVRTEALREGSPAQVLGTVADAFIRYQPDSYCTAVLAVVAPPPRSSLRLASGGHHLPLLSRRGEVRRLGEGGQILGLLAQPALCELETEMELDDLLVFFTDGVVEGRRDGELFGDDRLQAVLEKVAGEPAQSVADAVLEAAVGFQAGSPHDDIAVLACRWLSPR